MKYSCRNRLLSLLLALVLLVSCPVSLMAEAEETETAETMEEVSQATEESTAAVEESTQAEETTGAVVEITEPITEPFLETVETEMPVLETTGAAEEVAETTEVVETGAELPYGFLGLPEGYELTQEQLQEKQDMVDHAVAEGLNDLSAGGDYDDGVVMFGADSEEEALAYARAYNAELLNFSYGIGTMRLMEASVAQAVEAAQNMELPLPAVWPDYIVRLEPVQAEPEIKESTMSTMGVPERQDWDSWVNSALTNPDPALRNPASSNYQYHHDVIDSYAAWGVSTGKNVTVAVVDSGVNGSNPDLSGKVSYITVNSNLGTADENGHGTHVAGIIAATMDNGLGGAGVAPDAKILSVRVMDADGRGSTSDIIRGVNAAIPRADIINMSLGGIGYSGLFQKAVSDAVDRGVIVVASMGNEGHNGKNYPAAYDGVIGVLASDRTNTRAPYSQYGTWGDIAAPGTSIYATYNNSTNYPGNFGFMTGTSMATPVVSGVLALYMSVNPWESPEYVESRMKATATKVGGDLKCGIINAAAMLSEKPDSPIVYTNSSRYDSDDFKTGIPCDVKLQLYATNHDRNAYILYTLDGKAPSVKNGQVVAGTQYTDPIDLTPYAGQTITLKAAQVNGLGMMGAIETCKVKVDRNSTVSGIRLVGPSKVIAGKKTEFTAVVYPVETADQSVKWSIVRDGGTGATINEKTGVLTTLKGRTGMITIRATCAKRSNRYGEIEVEIGNPVPAAKVTIEPAKLSLYIGGYKWLDAKAVDTQGNSVLTGYLWTSSNTKVVQVNADGRISAVASGSATITAKALDGSGKSAKCTVTVLQQAEEIEITGQDAVAPGTSVAYKATVYPKNVSSKAVTWSVSGSEGVSIDAKTGKLTIPYWVSTGRYITIQAQSQDGYVSASYSVAIRSKCTSLTLSLNSNTGRAPGAVYNKGVLTEVGLFSVNRANATGENQVILKANCENSDCIQWSSSNPYVASVDANGRVTAFMAGTTKITATANDGSKKKATVTIKITNPVSTMALNSNVVKSSYETNYIGIGKSVSLTPVFADTYGVPSNKKVTWSWGAKYNRNGSWYNANGTLAGAVRCANGKLTVKATDAVKRLERNYDVRITVTATATDGTGVYATREFRLVTLASQIGIYDSYRQNDGSYVLYFYSDQQRYGGAPEFAITASKPDCVNIGEVFATTSTLTKNGRTCWIYGVQFLIEDRGTANISIKTTDGSNKSITYKLKAY